MQTHKLYTHGPRDAQSTLRHGAATGPQSLRNTDPGGGQADTRTHPPRPRSSPAPGLLPAPAHGEEKPAESAGTLTPEPWPTATPLF